MLTFSTPQLQAIVKEKLLGGAGEDTTEYHAFTDLEQSVRGGKCCCRPIIPLASINLPACRSTRVLLSPHPLTTLHPADDVALLRASPLVLPGIPIFGGIYDVHTGKIDLLLD